MTGWDGMTPKTDIRYNFDYARRLYAGDKQFKEVWEDIIRQGADFEEVYGQVIDKILAAIPEVTGYLWDEDHTDPFIPIYVVNTAQSFPHPLTISVSDDIGQMVVQMIAQLVHRNIYYGFKEEAERAAVVYQVAAAVARKIGIDLEDSFQEAVSKNFVHFGNAYVPKPWNLADHTAKYFLEQ